MKNHQTELTENEELCDLYRKKAEDVYKRQQCRYGTFFGYPAD